MSDKLLARKTTIIVGANCIRPFKNIYSELHSPFQKHLQRIAFAHFVSNILSLITHISSLTSMINFQIAEYNFKIAENWADLSHAQMLKLASFCGLHPEKRARITHEYIWKVLLSENEINVEKFWKNLQLSPSQWYQLTQMVAWVYETKPNVLKVEHFNGLYVTDFNLAKCSALEIAWLNVAYINLTKATTEAEATEGINEILAIAARPKMKMKQLAPLLTRADWNQDVRLPLSQYVVDTNKKAVQKLPLPVKTLIVQYILCALEAFVAEFDVLFNAPDNGTIAPDYPEGFGWEAHLRRLAGEGRFGTYPQVCLTNGRTIWLNEYQTFLDNEAALANARLQADKQ
jgi:hypothetical protein